MLDFDGNITEFIWDYYFPIHEMVHICRVAGVDCSIPHGVGADAAANYNSDNAYRQGDTLITPVAAGKWETRILADNDQGTNFMCHTLIANRSVTFDEKGFDISVIKIIIQKEGE